MKIEPKLKARVVFERYDGMRYELCSDVLSPAEILNMLYRLSCFIGAPCAREKYSDGNITRVIFSYSLQPGVTLNVEVCGEEEQLMELLAEARKTMITVN